MGGVCIHVQESLNYVRLDLEKYCQDKNFEVCAIKIHLDTKSVLYTFNIISLQAENVFTSQPLL